MTLIQRKDYVYGAVIPYVDFNTSVRTEEFREDKWNETYIIGDVHGCFDELRSLISVINLSQDDLLLFVGDLIRKGPESERVARYVMQNSNMKSVRGNNEEKLISDYRIDLSCYDRPYGGSFNFDQEVSEYICKMPHVISIGSDIVLHAGIDTQKDIEDNTRYEVLHSRSPIGYGGEMWYESYEGSRRIFFGHTVHDDILERQNSVGLDTGCVYGGELSAIRISDGKVYSVSSKGYRERDNDKIVNTHTERSVF